MGAPGNKKGPGALLGHSWHTCHPPEGGKYAKYGITGGLFARRFYRCRTADPRSAAGPALAIDRNRGALTPHRERYIDPESQGRDDRRHSWRHSRGPSSVDATWVGACGSYIERWPRFSLLPLPGDARAELRRPLRQRPGIPLQPMPHRQHRPWAYSIG